MGCCGIVEKLSARGRFLTVRCSDGSYAVLRAAAPAEASPGDIVEWEAGALPILVRNLTRDGRAIQVNGARYSLPEAAAAALVATLVGHSGAGFSRP
jgi:hypothetical protein